LKSTAPEVAHVINAISDEISLRIFQLIKESTIDTDSLKLELKLSCKQCYDKIEKLMDNGLIKRKNRYYSVTSFGQAVYEAQAIVNKAIQNRSRLEIVGCVRR